MTYLFLEWIFDITMELDGSLNQLNTETIQYQYKLEQSKINGVMRMRRKRWLQSIQ